MIKFYIVYYVHDDYAGDTTLWRCAKNFEDWDEAQKWASDQKLNVMTDTKTWVTPPHGFDEDDLDCIEVTVTDMEDWIQTLEKKAEELENYKEAELVDEEDDDGEDTPSG